VIGYGKTRPVFVLADNMPGYQQGLGYMFLFAGGKPRKESRMDFATGRPAEPIVGTFPPEPSIPDANPGTFYSAMSNEDFEIGKGNPAAVAIRFHVAQHCYLAHMDFWIGSGLAALKDIGNEGDLSAGQVLVYSPDGKLEKRIDVPERPIDLVFGGADRRTLYILTHPFTVRGEDRSGRFVTTKVN
jgi:SMP-30/Gluconolactonase/LRE-like region